MRFSGILPKAKKSGVSGEAQKDESRSDTITSLQRANCQKSARLECEVETHVSVGAVFMIEKNVNPMDLTIIIARGSRFNTHSYYAGWG